MKVEGLECGAWCKIRSDLFWPDPQATIALRVASQWAVEALSLRVKGSGFGVWGLEFEVWGLGLRLEILGSGVWGLRFRVWGAGIRVEGVASQWAVEG